jgi:hypothetical protein
MDPNGVPARIDWPTMRCRYGHRVFDRLAAEAEPMLGHGRLRDGQGHPLILLVALDVDAAQL